MINLTFSIPAYNDEKSLEPLVRECIEVANKYEFNYKFFIVNDGSKDNTASVADAIQKKYNNATVVHHSKNLSFGPTLKEVFTSPESEWICFMPGDHQFSAFDFVIPGIPYMKEYDFILGYRVERADNMYRRFISNFYNLCISIIARKRVKDVNSSVIFNRKILKNIDFQGTSAFAHAELFLHAHFNGYRIIEVPIKHKEREYGKAGGSKFEVIFKTMKDMIKYAIRKYFK